MNSDNAEQWGGWALNPQTRVLVLPHGLYEVDLDRCLTSAQVLDWIVQVSNKTWATPEILAGLIRALVSVLDPQATMCSSGVQRMPLTEEQIKDRVWGVLA